MDVDLIILQKNDTEKILDLSFRQSIISTFKECYLEVTDDNFVIENNNEKINVNYKLSSNKSNMVYVKLSCLESSIKSANVLDTAIKILNKSKHRKHWNIIVTNDEASQLYCSKLMPLFGIFERRTREFVYITIIKIFGVEWYEKSFNQEMKDALKAKGNKSKLVEGALNELTYEQLKTYLFEPFSGHRFEDMMNNELAADKIVNLSKEKIIELINKCRSVSLWDRFFSDNKQFKNFNERISSLQPYRNAVMHNKRITQNEYKSIHKELKDINKKLKDAISILENEIYTETKLSDILVAYKTMYIETIGKPLTQLTQKLRPALSKYNFKLTDDLYKNIDELYKILFTTKVLDKFNIEMLTTADKITDLSATNSE